MKQDGVRTMHMVTDHCLLSEISQVPAMKRTFRRLDRDTKREILDELHFELADLESFNVKVFKRVVGRVKRRRGIWQ